MTFDKKGKTGPTELRGIRFPSAEIRVSGVSASRQAMGDKAAGALLRELGLAEAE